MPKCDENLTSRPGETGAGTPQCDGLRPYTKPALQRVSLRAEEVLAFGCKTTGGSGGVNLAICGLSSCATIGS